MNVPVEPKRTKVVIFRRQYIESLHLEECSKNAHRLEEAMEDPPSMTPMDLLNQLQAK